MLILLFFMAVPAHAAGQPVIDMHFHAWPRGVDGPPDAPENLEFMRNALAALEEHNIVLAATSGPEEFLERWYRDAPDRLILGPIFPCDEGLNPNWKRYRCFRDGGEFPDLAWLEKQYETGTYEVMGELTNQYAGVPYDDPRMDPYYALAERMGIPVAIHTHAAPPRTNRNCCPKFRLSIGDPMKLEEILIAYPKLKVQIMHANPLLYPMLPDLLIQHPQVNVDIAMFQQIYPRERFHRLLAAYKEAGLLGRIMFGADGDDYGRAVAAYTSAEFLTDRELEGILCRNAEKFLEKSGLCETEPSE